jgi:hypothetical protein
LKSKGRREAAFEFHDGRTAGTARNAPAWEQTTKMAAELASGFLKS